MKVNNFLHGFQGAYTGAYFEVRATSFFAALIHELLTANDSPHLGCYA